MFRILLRKLLLGVLYLFAISLAAFVMSRQMPGDPAEIIANQGRETEAPPELVERIRQEYGFDRGWAEQYARWLRRAILERDLGYSTSTRRPVIAEIKESLPVSLRLGMITFAVTVLISFPLGVLAGVTTNKVLDVLIQVTTWTSYSMPVFLVGTVLIWLFAVEFQLLPSIGHDSWRHYVLPVAALALHLCGWTTQIIRCSVEEIAGKPYILAARAKGLPRKRVILVHVLKPALLPIATALLIQLGNLASGSFIIETIFAWNGVGRLLIDSIMARDFPMIQGILLCVGGIFALINVVIDMLYLYLDPSIVTKLAGGQRS
jgi:ABC-type dipeptide/oligopeptide/nickel transport system permease component